MLNRQLSSSSSPLLSSADNKNNSKNKKQSPRSPLRDLNGIAAAFPSHTSSCSSSSSSSSSISIEAPRGCLRFFLSNSSASKTPIGGGRPKSLSKKTPKSAPNGNTSELSSSRSNKPLKENLPKPTSRKEKPKKNPPCLYHWQSAKKPYSKTVPKPKHPTGLGTSSAPVVHPGSEEFSQNLKDFKHQRKQWPAIMVDESGEPPKLLNLPAFSTALVENSTPVGKLACGSVLGCELDDKIMEEDPTQITATTTTTTTTPPVQASVSPEIQCGSSMLVSAATPCYGAGHIISGVTDRRKCRAKGILTVGEIDSNCPNANIFDNSDDEEILSKSKMAFVPLPAEASMRWVLSPCDEEDDNEKSNPDNGLRSCRKSAGSAVLHSVSSPSSGHGISSDLCNVFENSSTTSAKNSRRSKIILLSPSRNPSFQGILGASSSQMAGCSSFVSPHDAPICETVNSQEQEKHRYDLAGENSSFSINSLGSGNMIQTPESDTNSDRHVGLSCLNAHDHQKHDFRSEIDSVAEVLLRASVSPNTQISIWDAPGLSFQFSDLISPSNSIDLGQLSNIWDSHASCISNSALEEMSESQMRISWRDGLVSRIFEMNEYDCCRCFSDDENDANECSIGNFKSSPSQELNVEVGNVVNFSNGFGSPKVVGHELKSDGQGKEKFPLPTSNPCRESIYTDGGGLVASGDSDWTLCYKNQLFES